MRKLNAIAVALILAGMPLGVWLQSCCGSAACCNMEVCMKVAAPAPQEESSDDQEHCSHSRSSKADCSMRGRCGHQTETAFVTPLHRGMLTSLPSLSLPAFAGQVSLTPQRNLPSGIEFDLFRPPRA